jgi:predicted SnoaL-like aldol condensation-catalyzing enzyme
MSIEANKALARRFVDEIANRGNLAIADELFAPDFETRDAVVPTAPGPEGVKQVFRAVLAAFPDFHETVEDVLADEDRVMVRLLSAWTDAGCHSAARVESCAR